MNPQLEEQWIWNCERDSLIHKQASGCKSHSHNLGIYIMNLHKSYTHSQVQRRIIKASK